MILISQFDTDHKPQEEEKQQIIDFLFLHLDEYGDPKKDIGKCIDYALQEFTSFGGSIITIKERDELAGVVVLNRTGMGGYIPENILVYIAIHKNHRGKGLGKKLMTEAINRTQGDIALHVEANNPAKYLYERIGFTNPYLEMRLKK